MYLLSRVLHDWSDEDAARVLNNVARVADHNASVYVIERHVGAAAGHHGVLSLHMFLTHGTLERSTEQWQSLVQSDAAGGWFVESTTPHHDHVVMRLVR